MWAVASHYLRSESVRSRKVATNAAKYARRSGYLRDLVLTPGAGKEVRVWGMLGWLTDQFTEEWWRVIRPIWRERARGDWVHAGAALVSQGACFIVLATVGVAAARGEIDLPAGMSLAIVGATGAVEEPSAGVVPYSKT